MNFFYPFLVQQNQFEQQIWFQLKSSVTICTKVMPLWLKRSVTIFTKVMPLWQNFKSLIVYLLIIWGIQVLIIFLFKLATLHPPVKSLLQLLSCHAESVSKDLNSRPQPPQPEPFTLSLIYIKEIWLEAAGHMLGFNQLECFI